MSEMLQATTEFRKNGFNDEDAAQLGQIASMYQNVSDEMISAGDSASFIISQLVAFGDEMAGFTTEAEKATHVIDAVNEVANSFSVSSADLANNLGNMSAVMAQTGASFEESLGMLTAITEVTRNASKASRGLVSIGSRLNQVVDESSSTGKALKEIYEGLNIALFDNEGQLRSSYEIFSDLAVIWDTLDKNTQNYIASQQAGTNQFQTFAALMSNFSTATEATSTALNSAGSAAQENAAYMEGLEAKTNLLKSTFQELANNVIDSQLVKSLLDLANAFLSLLNTPVGTFITQVTLLTGVMWGFVEVVKAMQVVSVIITQFKALIGIIPGLNTAMAGTATSTVAAAGGVTALGTALNFALPILGLLSVALVAIPQIVDAVTVSLEEQQQKVDDLVGSLQNLQTEYDTLASKENLTEAEEKRLQLLEAQIEANKILLGQEAQKQYQMQFGEGSRDEYTPSVFSSEFWTTSGTEMGATGTEKIQNDIKNYNELQESIRAVDEEILSLDTNSDNYAKQVEKLIKKKQKLEEESTTLASGINKLAGELIDLTGNMTDIPPEAQEALDVFTDWAKSISNEDEVLESNSDTINNASNSINNLTSELENLSTVYDILSSAVEEYNANGEFSLDTITKLLDLDYDYLNALELQNGQLVLNSNELYNRAIGLKEQAKQELTAKTMTELNSIAMQDLAGAFRGAATDASNAEYDFDGFRQILLDFASGATTAGAAMNYLWTSMEPESKGGFTFSEEAKAAMNEVLGTYKNLMGQIDASVISFGNASQASSSAASAIKKETDVIKEQSDAFKEQNEILEHSIFLKEKQGATQQELISFYKDYQNKLHEQAEWFRDQGLDDNSEYIRDLQKQWWEYYDEIESLQQSLLEEARDAFDERLNISEKYINEKNTLDNWGADNEIAAYQRVLNWMEEWYSQNLIDYEYYWKKRSEIVLKKATLEKEAQEKAAEEAQKAWEEAQEAYIDSLEEEKDLYEMLFSFVAENAQKEIDILEEQRSSVEKYWQDKIDALQQVNDELNDQIAKEEALDALAKARQKKVMVYKNGRFQYVEDAEAISEAQANLEKIERDQILQEEVKNLEELRDKELASIDDQIEAWEKYKEEWAGVVDAYEEEQNKLLLEQKFGIDLENENWQKSLDNLNSYVEDYKELLQKIIEAQENFNKELGEIQQQTPSNIGSNIAGGGSGGGSSNSSGTIVPGSGSLSGTQYNAWAWVPGSGYVPVTVEGGKTQQWGLPEGTIIYGDEDAWIITGGGTQNGEGYTSEYYGKTPDNIWTPNKGSSDASDTRPSAPAWNTGGSSGGGGSSSSGSSKPSSGGNYTGSSTTGGPGYNIGSQAGKDFINNAKPGSTLTGGDGSSWTKNPDGSTTINRGDDTWVVPAHATGTLGARGGFSLVGEKGPELRVLNSGDGVIPSDITKNLWAWGAITPASMMNNIIGGLQSMGQQIGITIQNFNPNLPNVTDGQDFANYMRNNFWREAIQFAKA